MLSKFEVRFGALFFGTHFGVEQKDFIGQLDREYKNVAKGPNVSTRIDAE